jgi:hypothetical protein
MSCIHQAPLRSYAYSIQYIDVLVITQFFTLLHSFLFFSVVADWADWTKIINARFFLLYFCENDVKDWRIYNPSYSAVCVGNATYEHICADTHGPRLMWKIIKNGLDFFFESIIYAHYSKDTKNVVCLALIRAELNTFDYLLVLNSQCKYNQCSAC